MYTIMYYVYTHTILCNFTTLYIRFILLNLSLSQFLCIKTSSRIYNSTCSTTSKIINSNTMLYWCYIRICAMDVHIITNIINFENNNYK